MRHFEIYYEKKQTPKFKLSKQYGSAYFLGTRTAKNYVVRHGNRFWTNKFIYQLNEQRCHLFKTAKGDYFAQSRGGSIVLKLFEISPAQSRLLADCRVSDLERLANQEATK